MFKLIIRLAYAAVLFIQTLVIMRLVLTVVNANTQNNLVSWVLNTSDMFVNPFDGIVASSIRINTFAIPLTPVVALFVYALVAFILSELLKAFSSN